MPIVLKGVDPTTFNLIASIIAEILQLVGAFTLCSFLHLMVSVFVRSGKKIPVNALGPLPGGLIDAWHYAQAMKWAWPATVALFLFISDYATAGLGFDNVDQEGPQETVLNLMKRNDFVPYEAIGDPLLPFTASKLELLVGGFSSDGAASTSEEMQGEILQLASEEVMIASFLGAADSIAQGRSVFLEENEELAKDPAMLIVGQPQEAGAIFAGLGDSTILHGGNASLASVNLEIPLDCYDKFTEETEDKQQQENWMTEVQELRGPDDWRVTSHAPNCTFTAIRSSGVFGGSSGTAEVSAYARVGSGKDSKLLVQGQGLVTDNSTFQFPPEGLYLAREMADFRRGRRVFGFGGIQLGDTDIPFETTVVSSGETLPVAPALLDPEEQNAVRTREYTLASKVLDEMENCPRDPSGAEDTSCLVIVKVTCEVFGSEIGNGGLLLGYSDSGRSPDFPVRLDHNCVFDGDIEIIWGRNYAVDQQLLAAVAGIQARNSGWASSLRQKRTLSIHSIPAALFMLGTLDKRTSVEQVRSTTIDGVFISFMCVPACLCVIAGVVYLVGMKYLLPIPDDGSSIIQLGVGLAEQQTYSPFDQKSSSQFASKTSVMENISSHGLKWDGRFLSAGNVNPYDDESEYDDENGMGKIHEVDEQLLPEDSAVVETIDGDRGQDALSNNDTVQPGTGPLPLVSNQRSAGAHNPHEQTKDSEKEISNQPIKIRTVPQNGQSDSSSQPYCQKFLKGAGVYVFICIIFCIGMTLVAAVFIKTNIHDSGVNTSHSSPQVHDQPSTPQDNQDPPPLVPAGCFQNNEELRSAIQGYSFGKERLKNSIVSKYGNFEEWCVDYVDDFSFMFAALHKPQALNASSWNVSGARTFAFCFYNLDFSDSALDIGKWDVSRSHVFRGMFYGSTNLKANISTWDVSSGRDYGGMFRKSKDFNSDISQWDVSSGTDFSWMFDQAPTFNGDLSLWNVSSGIDFGHMFGLSTSFNSDVSQWNVSSGIFFSHMFYRNEDFNSDLSKWDVSSGTDFSRMFERANNFNPDLSEWDVSSGVDFSHMFDGDTLFHSDVSKWDVSSGTNFAYMFVLAGNLNSDFQVDLSKWNVSSGVNFEWMFDSAESFESDLSQWDVSSGTNFGSMFKNAISFDSDLSRWDVSSGTSFNAMFDGADSFNSDISDWDVSSGTDFGFMFYETSNFDQDLSSWDVSSGAKFAWMFERAWAFDQNLCSWYSRMDPSASTVYMFDENNCPCHSLEPGCEYGAASAEYMCHTCSPTLPPSTLEPTSSPRPSLSQIPTTETESPTHTCVDMKEWNDDGGDGCDWYSEYEHYACSHAEDWAVDGVSGLDACCACGGGFKNGDAPPYAPQSPQSPVSPSAPQSSPVSSMTR